MFKFSKVQKEAKAYIKWMQEPQQYSPWIGKGEGQMAGLLNYYENDPVWRSDPKLTILREIPKYVRTPGYPAAFPGRAASVGPVRVNMFAQACTGMATPEIVKRATEELKRIYG